MKQFVRKFVIGSALFVMAGMAAPALAQDAPKVDLGVGYQWLHFSGGSYPLGFNVDLSGAASGDLRWVAELGWSRDSEGSSALGVDASATALSVAGGVRWAPAAKAYKPYAQVLVGVQRDSVSVDTNLFGNLVDGSSSNFILQPGVGATFPVGAKWGLFGQADWRRVFGDGGANGVRLVAGARLALK
ncbi:MAG: outer membrane beta-barrel protein [Vicinamibacterales bacterium]